MHCHDFAQNGYYICAGALITCAGGGSWALFFWYWLIPLTTVFAFANWTRSVSEHYGLPDTTSNDLGLTRNFEGPRWERFIFTPHHIGIHLVHHLFPTIPFYNLPKAHALLKQLPEWADAHENTSIVGKEFGSVVEELTRPLPN